jgi:UPF0716 protein FxsA
MLDDMRRGANSLTAQGNRMSLVKWAIFGLLMLPFVEIAVFVAVAVKLGFLAALALMILTSLAGMAVLRSTGNSDITRVRTAFGDRTIRHTELNGAGIFRALGGFLLLVPGFVTDVLGALLLFPPTQHLLRAALRRAVSGAAAPKGTTAKGTPGVVDLEPDQWQRVPEAQIPHDRPRRNPTRGGD